MSDLESIVLRVKRIEMMLELLLDSLVHHEQCPNKCYGNIGSQRALTLSHALVKIREKINHEDQD